MHVLHIPYRRSVALLVCSRAYHDTSMQTALHGLASSGVPDMHASDRSGLLRPSQCRVRQLQARFLQLSSGRRHLRLCRRLTSIAICGAPPGNLNAPLRRGRLCSWASGVRSSSSFSNLHKPSSSLLYSAACIGPVWPNTSSDVDRFSHKFVCCSLLLIILYDDAGQEA